MISKFDHDLEKFEIAINLRNKLLIRKWLIDFSFYVDDIMIICIKKNANRMRLFEKSLMKRFEIRVERIKEIFRNKNYSRSRKSQNLIVSRLLHQQNSDKISLERNEMLEDLVCEFVTN